VVKIFDYPKLWKKIKAFWYKVGKEFILNQLEIIFEGEKVISLDILWKI